MQRILMIEADSGDWCGIRDTFVYLTELENEEMAHNAALEEFEETMREHLFTEYYSSDETEEDYMPQEDTTFSFTSQWYSEEVYGDVDSGAYHKLN